MVAKFLVLVACVALSQGAMVRREAETPNILQDVVKHTGEFQKTFSDQLNALFNSKNAEDFHNALKTGSESVLQQIGALSSNLQGAMADASGKAKEALEQSKANLERTAEELRKSHPEVEQQASALKDKLQAAIQNAVQEAQNLAKAAAANVEQTNEKVAPKIQAAYNDFVKNAQDWQKKLHEVADKQ